MGWKWVWVALACVPSLWASPDLDELYTLKSFVAVSLEPRQQPVYAEHIENEIIRLLRLAERIEYSNAGFLQLKQRVTQFPKIALQQQKGIDLKPIEKDLKALKTAHGVDAVILAQIQERPDNFYVSMVLVVPENLEVLHQTSQVVDNRYSLESFGRAAREGLAEMLRGIPFDASVVSREGYRVVIDRGFPQIRKGMTLPAFTIQPTSGAPALEETGLVVITKVEERISFGQVLLERKPLEVLKGNKMRFAGKTHRSPWRVSSTQVGYNTVEQLSPSQVRKLGGVQVGVGATLVNLSQSAADGSGISSSNLFYPGGGGRAELWFTNHLAMLFSFQFGMTVINMPALGSTVNLNSNIGEMQALLAYQFLLTGPEEGPTLQARAGVFRQDFRIDVSPDPLSFTSCQTTGMLLGVAANLPVGNKWGFRFDASTVLFGGIVETPVTSGSSASPSIWDIKIATYYNLSPAIDLQLTGQFTTETISFQGTGTRAFALSQTSQSNSHLGLSLKHLF